MIPHKTFIDKRVEMQESSTQGQGLYAVAPIYEGETVVVWGGGVIVPNNEYELGFTKGLYQPESGIHYDEDHMWTQLATEPDFEDAAINHSCEPNLWFENGWPLVARRDIATGEEITFDYATGETWPMHSRCCCGAKNCREYITGEEWKDAEYVKRYKNHFNPYIQGLIDKGKK
jgi:SET domain-containing protein